MALITAALLCSCGRDSETPAYRAAHHPAAPALAPGDADLVSAVSSAGSAGPVGLRFRMPEPPRVGQPLQLELVLAQEPALEISHILVSLQAGDGLALESDRSIEFEVPPPGASHHMLVSLRAQQQGLLNLNATVLVDAGNTSLTRSFSIPLIAEP